MNTRDVALIGVDWGSTRVRAHAIGREGECIASVQSDRGMATLASPADFSDVLHDLLTEEIDSKGVPILIAGMAGARGGWYEVPYVELPVDPKRIASALHAVDFSGRCVAIVPGACSVGGDFSDVMRGEETQAFGLLAQARRVIAPGTHSKWIQLDAGRIEGFATYPTGELFAVLMQHSLIGRGLPAEAWSDHAFALGVMTAQEDPDWLHQLFGVRARHVRNLMPATELPALLSGLLIGHECRAALAHSDDEAVTIVGAARIAGLYAQALQYLRRATTIVEGDVAFCKGLWRISQAADLT